MAVAAPKKKRSLLPVLTVLFLVSYALMTMLIVEQGSTIQSQSNLIKTLMPDSTALWDSKAKAIGERQKGKTRGHADPSAQNPSTQSPSTQAAPRSQSQAGKNGKLGHQLPPVPASDLFDPRRAVHTI
jgi:hypothetical protein